MKKITLLVALFVAFSMNAQIFSDDFELEVVDATTYTNWTAVDQDGDGENWEVADVTGTDNEASPLSGLVADSDSWEGGTPFTPDNFLISTNTIDLTGVSDGVLTFTFGTYQTNGTFLEDRLSVYVTTSNDPAVIVGETPVFDDQIGNQTPATDGASSAVDINVDLSSFAGQQVYITFRHWDTFDHNSILLDNVVINGTLGVDDNILDSFSYFVNSNNILNMKANAPLQSIELYNVIGQQVILNKLSSTNETLDISNLNSGVYIAKVSIDGLSKSFKIVKK